MEAKIRIMILEIQVVINPFDRRTLPFKVASIAESTAEMEKDSICNYRYSNKSFTGEGATIDFLRPEMNPREFSVGLLELVQPILELDAGMTPVAERHVR